MAGLPWFRVYAAETLSDENFQSWTVEERGAWFTLILVAWREGSIPGDQTSLARLLHVDGNDMRSLWSAIGSRFVEHPDHPGRLTSPRLEMEREEAEKMSAKKSEAGTKGANSRWNKKNRVNGNRMRVPCADDATAMRIDSPQIQIRSDSDSEAVQTASTTPEPQVWEAFRDLLADRMVVPRDWLKVASADRAATVREQISAEVTRLGIPRALEVAAEAATKAKGKPRWLAYFVGPLQDARRVVHSQDSWQDAPRAEVWRDEQGRTLDELKTLYPDTDGVPPEAQLAAIGGSR